jgi:hypothetical protein
MVRLAAKLVAIDQNHGLAEDCQIVHHSRLHQEQKRGNDSFGQMPVSYQHLETLYEVGRINRSGVENPREQHI